MVDDDEIEIGGVFQHPAEDFGGYWASVVGDGDIRILEFRHAEFLTLEADGGTRWDGRGELLGQTWRADSRICSTAASSLTGVGVRHAEMVSNRRARRS